MLTPLDRRWVDSHHNSGGRHNPRGRLSMLSAPQPSPRVPAPASARGQDLLRNDGEEMLSSVNTRVLTCGGIGRLLPTHTGLSPARSGQRENPITRPHSSPSGRVGRADGPEQREVWTRVCNRSTIPPVSPQPFSGEAKGTAGLIVVDHSGI